MSFHEPHSDVSCINRRARRVPVQLHPWTWRVLREALRLSRATRGAFDVTVADRPVRWGYLPRTMAQTPGLVNAGGDLRAFGALAHAVYLRHPASPGKLLPAFELVSGALATSADYFARRSWRGQAVAPITLRKGRTRATPASVTVEARTCMLADALTKICLLKGPGLVSRLGGRALVLRPGDVSMWPVAA